MMAALRGGNAVRGGQGGSGRIAGDAALNRCGEGAEACAMTTVYPSNVRPAGGDLVRTAWWALRQDRELLALPVVGGVATVAALVPVLVLAALVPDGAGVVRWVVGALLAFVSTTVGTFFAVALAAGAHQRLSGEDPTFGSSVGAAWAHRRAVLGWSLLATVVGLVLRAIEERFKGLPGFLLSFTGGVAWAVASFFAIPIIAVHDVGPIGALKASAATMRERWSTSARVQLRLTFYWLGLLLLGAVGFVGAVVLGGSAPLLGVVAGVLVLAGVVFAALVLSCVAAYARVVLYRYAVGLPTPGFSAAQLEQVIVRG